MALVWAASIPNEGQHPCHASCAPPVRCLWFSLALSGRPGRCDKAASDPHQYYVHVTICHFTESTLTVTVTISMTMTFSVAVTVTLAVMHLYLYPCPSRYSGGYLKRHHVHLLLDAPQVVYCREGRHLLIQGR